uniref:Uncharacterized protein n=1 Tax=Gasterosteus aculeatus TaxID=69293 RepID=G3P606_GASAC
RGGVEEVEVVEEEVEGVGGGGGGGGGRWRWWRRRWRALEAAWTRFSAQRRGAGSSLLGEVWRPDVFKGFKSRQVEDEPDSEFRDSCFVCLSQASTCTDLQSDKYLFCLEKPLRSFLLFALLQRRRLKLNFKSLKTRCGVVVSWPRFGTTVYS